MTGSPVVAIAPPLSCIATFPMKEQRSIVSTRLNPSMTPPASAAKLSMNVQPTKVGSPLEVNITPPT